MSSDKNMKTLSHTVTELAPADARLTCAVRPFVGWA
jgi:hypothetical protein